MSPIIISLLVFLAVEAVIAVIFFMSGGENAKLADRLAMLTGKKKKEDEVTSILKKTAIENDKRSLINSLMPAIPSLQKMIAQADVHIQPTTLFAIGALLGLVGCTLSWVATQKIIFAPIVGLIFFFVPFLWVMLKRWARMGKYASQLPDALELVARALRAGHSLGAGMHVVAEEMPDPIAGEFNRVYEEQNLGIPVEDSLRGMCERVPNIDLRFFVTSVLIQRQTGGDLAEILDKIGYVIRERYRILGQVKALTAEGRLSGIVLIALPFGLLLMMLHIKYDYVEKLWTHPMGIQMSVVALIMQVVGALVIKKIVNIKV